MVQHRSLYHGYIVILDILLLSADLISDCPQTRHIV